MPLTTFVLFCTKSRVKSGIERVGLRHTPYRHSALGYRSSVVLKPT